MTFGWLRACVAAFALLVAASGCKVDSVNPISPPETAEADTALYGVWRYQGKDELAYVHIGAEFALTTASDPAADKHKRTRIVIVDHKPNGMTDEAYVAHGSRVGKQRFLNVVQLDGGPAGFKFVRYALVDRDTLRFSAISPEALKAAVSAGRVKGSTRGEGLSANSVLLWVHPKTARIVIGQFTERGTGRPVVATQPLRHKFDGSWMWTDKEGRLQPSVTLFDGLFRTDNPYLEKLDGAYRTLALRMRDGQCDNCHMPNNPMPMRRLILMHTPAHASGEISRVMKAIREDKMPLDDAGVETPLEPALKRALLESGGAFERLVQAAKDWEAAQRK
jgi:hypothetical protein